MSEYQYHEFAAMDRPLDLVSSPSCAGGSTRAEIASTSFVNSYQRATSGVTHLLRICLAAYHPLMASST